MNKQSLKHVAVIGIDGSGLLSILAENCKVAGIGDEVLINQSGSQLAHPNDIIRVKVKYALGLIVKLCKNKFFYEISKLFD